jgi:hypothetical protein
VEEKEATMSNPSLTEPENTNARPNKVWTFPALDDDDDDEADYDDGEGEDEDEVLAKATNERWFSRSGFGSPQWWSRL